MSDQHIEILKDNRSAYAWLLAIVALAIGLGLWFSPKADQPLFVWLLVAIISFPAFLLFILGTFTSYFDLKITDKGITFGGYSGRRKYNWEEITKIVVTGGDECPRIALSLTPILKNKVEYHRADEVLPKLYGFTPKELKAKLKHWLNIAQNSKKQARGSNMGSFRQEIPYKPLTRMQRLIWGIFLIVFSILWLFEIGQHGIVGRGTNIRNFPPFNIIAAIGMFFFCIYVLVWKIWEK